MKEKKQVNSFVLVLGIVFMGVGFLTLHMALLVIGLFMVLGSVSTGKGKEGTPQASRMSGKGRSEGTRSGSDRFMTPPKPASGPSFNPNSSTHAHITTAWVSKDKRVEQLKVMLDAGLIDREEYRERLARVNAMQ